MGDGIGGRVGWYGKNIENDMGRIIRSSQDNSKLIIASSN
jgi:hypothetical protein